MKIELNGINFDVVITKKRIKNIYFRIKEDLRIYVSCSYLCSDSYIEKLLIKNEKDILPVSFGAMLLECMLAVIALIAVGYLAVEGNAPTGMTQPQVFASAVATFLTKLSIPENISITLITLSVSASTTIFSLNES